MPLYMDVHKNVDESADEVAEAHRKDVELGKERGITFREYWMDEETGTVFCLYEAPSEDAGQDIHREAHGLVTAEVYEVEQGE